MHSIQTKIRSVTPLLKLKRLTSSSTSDTKSKETLNQLEYDRDIMYKGLKKEEYRPKIGEMIDRQEYPKMFLDNKWDNVDTSIKGIKFYFKNKVKRDTVKDQTYDLGNVDILGPDLNLARLVVQRGGAVQFIGHKDFVYRESISFKYVDLLPTEFDASLLVETVNAGPLNMTLGGLQHFQGCKYLKNISLSGSSYFDNWGLDYLARIVPQLEYLDISKCRNVSHNAVGAFYKFKDLKCVNVSDISDDLEFRLAFLSLEAELGIKVVGLLSEEKREDMKIPDMHVEEISFLKKWIEKWKKKNEEVTHDFVYYKPPKK